MIGELRGALGGWGFRRMLSQVLVMLLYPFLSDIRGKMERLAARFQAGGLWRGRPRLTVGESVAGTVEGRVSCRNQPIFPCRFGWLVWLAGYQAAGYGSQLRAILGTPDMVALLIAAPQAARVLRPLCRMLAVETSLLRPGAGQTAAAVGAVEACGEVGAIKGKRGRVVREAVDPGRVRLGEGLPAEAQWQGVWKGG